MKVTIYSLSKNVMQSARGKVGNWVLEYEQTTARNPDALMGWASSGDTLNQVRLNFDSREDAISYAEENNWQYVVMKEHIRKVKPRNYGDNFKYFAEEA